MNFLSNLISRYRNIRHCLKHPIRPNSWTYRKYQPGCDFNGRRVLNLGCGSTVFRAPNVVNLDMFPGDGINVVHDLSKTPLPFKDNEFDLVIANHILEHVPGWWNCFKELCRVVKVGGIIEVWGPADGGSSQLGYRDHINVINHCSFAGIRGNFRNLTNSWEAYEQENNLGYAKDVEYAGPHQILLPNWWFIHLLPDKVVKFMVDHLRNVAIEVGMFFVKKEPFKAKEEYAKYLSPIFKRGGQK